MKKYLPVIAILLLGCSKPKAPEPAATPAPAAAASIPYGIPVPGKPGYVSSPYSKDGYIDVRGFPPNTEVKDPYSGKIFRVP